MKMIKTIVILLGFFLLGMSSPDKLNDIIKNSDYTFILKIGLGDCPKCINLSYDIFEKFEIEFGISKKISFIALIICDREKELKLFKKNYSIIDYVFKYNEMEYKLDSACSDCILFIYNKKNLLIANYSASSISNFSNVIKDLKTKFH
jgi:hypothetical protein